MFQGSQEALEVKFLKDFRAIAGKTMFQHELLNALKESLDKLYPSDVHEICENKVFISVSKMSGNIPKFGFNEENVLYSEFTSKEDLINKLAASCLVPLWAGTKWEALDGNNFYDGGFTDNLPEIRGNETLRIQPFSTTKERAEISVN